MWLTIGDFNELQMRWIATIGRAMVVAQHFEYICKGVMTTACWAKEIEAGRVSEWSEGRSYVEKLEKILLDGAIKKLGSIGFEEGDIETLSNAKRARNYFAHESAKPVHSYGKKLLEELPSLTEQIRILAHGDNLVSCWSYEISEKEPAGKTSIKSTYVEDITKWVTLPLLQLDSQCLWQILKEECSGALGSSRRLHAWLRSQQRCECTCESHSLSHLGRCNSTKNLQYHHLDSIVPTDDNSSDDYRILCDACHLHIHMNNPKNPR